MSRKSIFSGYKSNVKYYLTRVHNWPNQTALNWLNSNKDYVRAMCERACPATEAALLIHDLKRERNVNP